MSQHYFRAALPTGGFATVIMGWDRPLGHFFMVIEGPEDDEKPLYSNLDDPTPFSHPLSYYQDKLAQFGLTAPPEMLAEIQLDAERGVGNRHVWWTAEGKTSDSLAGCRA